MKKLLFTLMMALPVLFLAACHDDDDLPEVSLNVAYSGGVVADGHIYVVQGDTLSVDSVWVTPENGTKNATVLAVSYRLDGWLVANVPFVPFACDIPTYSLEPGSYALGIECPIIQVDKTPATAYTQRKITIVDDVASIPGQASRIDMLSPDLQE